MPYLKCLQNSQIRKFGKFVLGEGPRSLNLVLWVYFSVQDNQIVNIHYITLLDEKARNYGAPKPSNVNSVNIVFIRFNSLLLLTLSSFISS